LKNYEFILVERTDQVLTITINRPTAMNALHPPAHHELADIFDRYQSDGNLRLACLTGIGNDAFCVGSDLREATDRKNMPATGFGGLTERFDLDKPVIAAVNGHCIGGGLELALASDLVIAADHAKFGLPEPKVGLAATGGLHRLFRQLPTKHAMEIALTGKLFSAAEAKTHGLVNAVVPAAGLAPELAAWTAQILDCAPLALEATKQMALRGQDATSLRGAFENSYPALDAMLASEDAREGPRAFLEKRPPKWTGR
jgi:crotonobetainyl-CoA hydratase